MGFSIDWEERYRENTHLAIYPWSDLVSIVNNNCKELIRAGGGRVLEFGCGAGANIPLFMALEIDYVEKYFGSIDRDELLNCMLGY